MATIQGDRPVEVAEASPRRFDLSLTGLCGLVVAATGFVIGLQPLRDNSFLTHLATGRLILDQGGVPGADPYTWTVPGTDWTVQSWLASLLYALAEDLAGEVGLRLVIAAASGLLAWFVWRLTEPAVGLVARVALAVPVLVIGADGWTERPLLFGLVFLAAAHLLANGHGRAWWALPVFVLWVNTHGSFPLGLVLLVLLAVGTRLDGEPWTRELEVLRWAVVGVLVGAVNPVGPRLLVFPLELLQRSEVLGFVKEWKSPDFAELAARIFVVLVAAAVVVLVRRPRYRAALPVVVFVAAALLGARNVVPASIVVLAATAPGLRGLGSELGERRSPAIALGGAAVAAVMSIYAVSSLAGPHYDLVGYPTDGLAWLEDHDLLNEETRLVSRDFVGNFLEAARGTEVPVFIDDRYDMYPDELVLDYKALVDGPGWEDVLARWDPDVVLWDTDAALAPILAASPDWEVVWEDDRWLIACPVEGAPPGCS
jgi:hypothetical protein